MVCITALMDNQIVGRKGLLAEHGLSMLVEYEGKRVLFDCGPGPNFLTNARRLGISLADLDAVVLSHSHYDHAAGYRDLVEAGLGSKVLYTGQGFFEPKYAVQGIRYSNLACGFDREFLAEHQICHREVSGEIQLFPGMWLVTGFPRNNDFEIIPEKFLRRTSSGFCTDDFRDEACLALETEGGLAMVVGCSHPGIVNMVTQVSAWLGKKVRAVFGGTHLSDARPLRLSRTLDALGEAGVEILGFSHCTGAAAEQLVEADSRFHSCHLGSGDCVFLEK